MCSQALLCKRMGPFLLTNAACRHCSFQCISLIYWVLLLRCHGFTRIQKAIVDQTGSWPTNSEHDFFWCKFGFGKCFGASSWYNHWTSHSRLSRKSTFHRTSQSDRETVHCCCVEKEKRTLQNNNFFDLGSVHQAFTYRAFSLFQFASKAKEGQNGQWWVLGQLLM